MHSVHPAKMSSGMDIKPLHLFFQFIDKQVAFLVFLSCTLFIHLFISTFCLKGQNGVSVVFCADGKLVMSNENNTVFLSRDNQCDNFPLEFGVLETNI